MCCSRSRSKRRSSCQGKHIRLRQNTRRFHICPIVDTVKRLIQGAMTILGVLSGLHYTDISPKDMHPGIDFWKDVKRQM